MGREKLTISLSSKCLELIDRFTVTTGFESRSRVIEELVFAVAELLQNRARYSQSGFQPKPSYTQEEVVKFMFVLSDYLSKTAGTLDRFVRFGNVANPVPIETNEPK
jgi:hypothetical protein